MFSMLVSI